MVRPIRHHPCHLAWNLPIWEMWLWQTAEKPSASCPSPNEPHRTEPHRSVTPAQFPISLPLAVSGNTSAPGCVECYQHCVLLIQWLSPYRVAVGYTAFGLIIRRRKYLGNWGGGDGDGRAQISESARHHPRHFSYLPSCALPSLQSKSRLT